MIEPSEFERGRYVERIHEHGRRLDAINGSLDKAEEAITKLALSVATLRRSVAIYAALAAGISSAVGVIVVAKLTGQP